LATSAPAPPALVVPPTFPGRPTLLDYKYSFFEPKNSVQYKQKQFKAIAASGRNSEPNGFSVIVQLLLTKSLEIAVFTGRDFLGYIPAYEMKRKVPFNLGKSDQYRGALYRENIQRLHLRRLPALCQAHLVPQTEEGVKYRLYVNSCGVIAKGVLE